ERYGSGCDALGEEFILMQDLRRRYGQIPERYAARFSRAKIPHEFRAAQIREYERLLNHHWRTRVDGHRSLVVLNRLADTVPSAGHGDGYVAGSEHGVYLLVNRLALEHCLLGGLAIVVAGELLNRIEIHVLVLQRVHQLVSDDELR